MAIRSTSIPIKKQILSVCARLFLEQGYHQTTVRQIAQEAGVSVSSFQNLFHTKDGVLQELVAIMFSGQFGTARTFAAELPSPIYVYAVETALQLVLTEQNEHLRDIYLEAYRQPATAEYIHTHTAMELYQIFSDNFPGYAESDFYEMELGSGGLICGFMEKPCDIHFPLRKKIDRFLSMSLQVYRVPEPVQQQVLSYVQSLDIQALADTVMQKLFTLLEMKFDFKLHFPARDAKL